METTLDTAQPTTARTAAASRARWKHGLYSKHLLGPAEDAEELESLRDGLMEAMQPTDSLETEIASNTVANQWLLRRFLSQQAGILELYEQIHRKANPDATPRQIAGAAVLKDSADGQSLHKLANTCLRLGNATLRNSRELRVRQDHRRKGFDVQAKAGSSGGCGGGKRIPKPVQAPKRQDDALADEIQAQMDDEAADEEILGDYLRMQGISAPVPVPATTAEPLECATGGEPKLGTGASSNTRSGESVDREKCAESTPSTPGGAAKPSGRLAALPARQHGCDVAEEAASNTTDRTGEIGAHRGPHPQSAPEPSRPFPPAAGGKGQGWGPLTESGAILAFALSDPGALSAASAPPPGLTAHDTERWWRIKRRPETDAQRRDRVRQRLAYLDAQPERDRAAHQEEYAVLRRLAGESPPGGVSQGGST